MEEINEKKKRDKRDYNVFLHTHTVSGIVISFGLFVIFFAGAFALFRDEINEWQYNSVSREYVTNVDYEKVFEIAKQEGYNLEHRTFNVRWFSSPKQPYVWLRAQPAVLDSTEVDKLDSAQKAGYELYFDQNNYSILSTEREDYSSFLGNYIYQLHFFRQIPVVGIYIAGFVSIFFLFAILTGVIVHWRKIKSNFFTFRLKSSLKIFWTDSHTALGVIGLPFQFMYAVTGSLYGLSILLLLPTVMIFFNGDRQKLIDTVIPSVKAPEAARIVHPDRVNINELTADFLSKQKLTGEVSRINAQFGNIGDENAFVTFTMQEENADHFYAQSYSTYNLKDGSVVNEKFVQDGVSYRESIFATFGALHFATFGGHFVKVIYFILALITCFVIISGVMIWLAARQTKKYAERATFITNVGSIYMGICLGLFPSMALLFIVSKIFTVFEMNIYGAYTTFFLFWLAFTVVSKFIKDTGKINRLAMLMASVLGLLIPVINGLVGGVWFWEAAQLGLEGSFIVDTAWICMSIITGLYVLKYYLKHKKSTKQVMAAV